MRVTVAFVLVFIFVACTAAGSASSPTPLPSRSDLPAATLPSASALASSPASHVPSPSVAAPGTPPASALSDEFRGTGFGVVVPAILASHYRGEEGWDSWETSIDGTRVALGIEHGATNHQSLDDLATAFRLRTGLATVAEHVVVPAGDAVRYTGAHPDTGSFVGYVVVNESASRALYLLLVNIDEDLEREIMRTFRLVEEPFTTDPPGPARRGKVVRDEPVGGARVVVSTDGTTTCIAIRSDTKSLWSVLGWRYGCETAADLGMMQIVTEARPGVWVAAFWRADGRLRSIEMQTSARSVRFEAVDAQHLVLGSVEGSLEKVIADAPITWEVWAPFE